MPNMSTHVLSTSKKHMTRSLEKSLGECCGSAVVATACYRPTSHCISVQKFVSVSAELNHNRSSLVLDSDKDVCCRHSSLAYMNWIYSHSRVDEGVTVGSCRINRLLLRTIWCCLHLLSKGLQHVLDRFSAACDQAGMKISAKKTRCHVSPETQGSVCCK